MTDNSWILDIKPEHGTVEGQYASVSYDSADSDNTPDVQPLNGTVHFAPQVPVGKINSTVVQIFEFDAKIFGGQIVDEEDSPGLRMMSTDAEIGVEDWAWRATFTFDSGLSLPPHDFKLPAGTTYSLSAGAVPAKGVPYQVVAGPQGASVVDAEDLGDGTMRFILDDGTKTSPVPWLRGPQGKPGDKGDQGTGLSVKGEKASTADLPTGAQAGDSWVVKGHLWVWQGSQWIDAGQFEGKPGARGYSLLSIEQPTPTTVRFSREAADGTIDSDFPLPTGVTGFQEMATGVWSPTNTPQGSPIPRLAGVTPTNDLAQTVRSRGQATGVLMPENTAAPDVILVVGQSNAAGNGHPVTPRTAPQHPLLGWWHTGADGDKGSVTAAQEPLARAYTGGDPGTSPGTQFGRRWAEWYRRRTIIVPAAWGGTGLISGGGRWQETGDLYQAAVREARDCIASTGGRLVAIIWCQGEQDSVASVSNSPTDGYGVVAARVLNRMRTDLGASDAVIAVGSMAPDWVGLGQGTAQDIQGALANLPTKLSRCVFAYGGAGTGSEGGNDNPGIHYDARGTRQLGNGLWDAYQRLVDPTLGPARPPAPGVAATSTGARAYLVASPGATGYEARYRTAGDWQTATMSGMTVDVPAAADALVEVQVRGTASGKSPSPWSASGLVPVALAGTSLLVDLQKGTPHFDAVTSVGIGGGRFATQPTAVSQPRMLRTGGINDGPAMVFDGRDDYLAGPSVAATALGASAGTFSVVAVAQARAAHDGSFFGWRSDSASIFNLGMEANGAVVAQGFTDSDAAGTARAQVDMTRPHVIIADRWYRGVTLTVDGTELNSINSFPARSSGSAIVVLGAAYRGTASSAPLQLWDGRLGWLAIFPNVLTTGQKAAVTAYLRGRFNI